MLFGLSLSGAVWAQDTPANESPLSVIDWLGQNTTPAALPSATPDIAEPAVATTGSVPEITVTPLGVGRPREIGLVPTSLTGLPSDLWVGSDVIALTKRLAKLPDLRLPAAQALLYTVLLAEAQAPRTNVQAGDALALARVQTLMDLGALDPALSLMEQAGVTTSAQHFDLWMQISLLNGTEDRACVVLAGAPHLTTDYGTRILCAARAGKWENAALTLGSAKALALMPADKLELLDRFLNPDFFEDAEPMRAPRKMDPLSFRMFESIGERMPTGNLPRAFAVADLRDVAGWKAQLEAAERLTRAGALPDNRLLGLYTHRKPAASGGVWDRVAALQRFETALSTGSAEAVGKTLPSVWRAMKDAELETTFATLFYERLQEVDVNGSAARLILEIGLLSPQYETAARTAPDTPDTAFLRSLAMGEPTTNRPLDALSAAAFDGFATAKPRAELVQQAREQRLGESILRLLVLLEDGAQGDASALRDAISTLRALGLEDTARRAALQALLLER